MEDKDEEGLAFAHSAYDYAYSDEEKIVVEFLKMHMLTAAVEAEIEIDEDFIHFFSMLGKNAVLEANRLGSEGVSIG